jgi:hypothetical protein
VAGNLTISNGIRIATNGFDIYVANRLIAESDIIITGTTAPVFPPDCQGCAGLMGLSANLSFGGSGASGGGWAESYGGGAGGNTQSLGGWATIGVGSPGSVPKAPILNNANIISWYESGMQNFLEGAGGGGGGEGWGPAGEGGAGAFGLYIQAQDVMLANTTITSDGTAGGPGWANGGGGGGGGGCGKIVVSYQNLYVPARYQSAGGTPGPEGGDNGGYWGGQGGGPCNTTIYKYQTEPILLYASSTTTTISPNSGGGSTPPPGSCYLIQGLTTQSRISVYLTGAWFTVTANSIAPEDLLILINGVSYTIVLGATQQLPGVGAYAYNASVTAVVQHASLNLYLCSSYVGQTTTTTTSSTTTTSLSSVLSSSTAFTSSLESSTTMIQADPKAPPSKSSIWALLLLLLLIAIGLFVERERRKK